ncbi:type III-B CRISPR module-associated protein Cmr5 [Candidatus Chloroploca sp. M-50]|uniref:CRISPR type III-B/RAMP module-associated protein Cmr5 n=1 Tax=Candidatus Chloroploca mongolica TaxID=2528176 RepID=A0ABS4DG85_9CHLR|nr:type III-B CRISPR module-associated protein Cmr5 [Candidatus Chloroploca mongolica]MBP1468455.1 type III-B CRISPR module-associated protein Cmr5 [Candidatus Chloroploca mongolica]
MQTRNQRLAATIYAQVAPLKDHPEKTKYGSMAHQLPVLIQTAGLAQALTFVAAKGNAKKTDDQDAYFRLLRDLAHVVLDGPAEQRTRAALLQRSREAPLGAYMLLTRRTLEALLWYKRFAQAELDVEQGQEVAS